jgi:hypothetical protein
MHSTQKHVWHSSPPWKCITIVFDGIRRLDTSVRSFMSRWENNRMKETFDVIHYLYYNKYANVTLRQTSFIILRSNLWRLYENGASSLGGGIVPRLLWKYQYWLDGFNGGPIRQPHLRLNDRQMGIIRSQGIDGQRDRTSAWRQCGFLRGSPSQPKYIQATSAE